MGWVGSHASAGAEDSANSPPTQAALRRNATLSDMNPP
jgi:hypothetical protein